MADIAALLRDAGLLVADAGEGGDALADLLLGGQPEAQPQPRFRRVAIDRPFRPGIGLLAKELNIPVVPVKLHGLYELK